MNKFLILGALLILPSASGVAQESDSFDDFDKMLDRQFEDADSVINARYDAVDKAIDRAFQGLTRKIEVHWGENTRMPERETWVTYSDGMDARMSLDFKKSEMVLEQVVPADADIGEELEKLGAFAGQLMQATPAELNASDSLVKEIKSELEAAEIKTEQPVEVLPVAKPPPTATPPEATIDNSAPPQTTPAKATTKVKEPDNVIGKVVEVAEIEKSLTELAAKGAAAEKAAAVAIEQKGSVKTLKVTFPFVSNAQRNIMQEYMGDVREYASTYDIPVSVILAIIETESSFNPRAVSPIPAFGLMQLVPRTAGVDAYHRVHGEKKVVEPHFLFNEVNNIQLGSAYLHVVRDRYLRKIKNPYSRFYCAIAAYNTGVGNVAKVFSGTTSLNAAARYVNKMSEQEVYDYLLENLPAEETRNYLRKIVARIENYKHLDMG